MEDLPMMMEVEEPPGIGVLELDNKIAAKLTLDNRCLIRPAFAEQVSVDLWRKTPVCNIILLSEEMNAFTIKSIGESCRPDLSIIPNEGCFSSANNMAVAFPVSYQNVLKGVRNVHAHAVHQRPRLRDGHPSDLVGFLVRHGSWPVAVYFSFLALMLSAAIGVGLDLDIPTVGGGRDLDGPSLGVGRLTPFGSREQPVAVPSGLYIYGGSPSRTELTCQCRTNDRWYSATLPIPDVLRGRITLSVKREGEDITPSVATNIFPLRYYQRHFDLVKNHLDARRPPDPSSRIDA